MTIVPTSVASEKNRSKAVVHDKSYSVKNCEICICLMQKVLKLAIVPYCGCILPVNIGSLDWLHVKYLLILRWMIGFASAEMDDCPTNFVDIWQ